MSDSDETIFDDGEDQAIPNQSQISPSILSRKDSFDHEGKEVGSGGSPEFLPPSAKIQKLENENKEQGGGLLNQERPSLPAESTSSTEKPGVARLKLIKEKEEKIEKLLETLESKVKGGASLRDDPIFAQAKLLMTQVKTQLTEFTQYQQEQRKKIAKSSHKSQDSQDTLGSQWTQELKQKIVDLASQQKELLKRFQCHKKLLEKIQELKHRAKSGTKHILPAVEMHCKSQRNIHMVREVQGENANPPSSTNMTASNLSQQGSMTSDMTLPANELEKTKEQSMSRVTTISSSSKSISSSVVHLQKQPNSYQVSSTALQVIPSFCKTPSHSGVSTCTPVLATHGVSNVTLSGTPQPRAQNVELTAGQLYQVGDRHIFVLPQGLKTNVTASLPATQVSHPQQGTVIPQSTMASLAPGVPLPQPSTMMAITAVTNSTQSNSRSHVQAPIVQSISQVSPPATQVFQPQQGIMIPQSTMACLAKGLPLPQPSTMMAITAVTNSTHGDSRSHVQAPIVQSISQVSICSNQAPNTGEKSRNATAKNSYTSPLPTTTDGLLKMSSVNALFGNHGSRQTTHAGNPLETDENNTAFPIHSSLRKQSQNTKSPSTAPQTPPQPTMTITSITSKTVQSRSQSLQRRNSFGSELPDVKSLLNHNVIEPGSNVLSIQFEGRKFEASLRENGLIESAGGETFRTPMAWMRAVTGYWNTVKQSQAYKMVHYKGTPLALFTIPSLEKDPIECRGKQNDPQISDKAFDGQDKIGKLSGFITSCDDVAHLLTDCRVMPIGSNELFPVEGFLPPNFWDCDPANEVDLPQSILAELDF